MADFRVMLIGLLLVTFVSGFILQLAREHPWRFSLRALLVTMTLIAMLLMAVVYAAK